MVFSPSTPIFHRQNLGNRSDFEAVDEREASWEEIKVNMKKERFGVVCVGKDGTHLFVTDILQCVRHDGDSHVHKIAASHFEYLLTELFAIFVNFLYGHRPHNRTLVALERNQGDVLDLRLRFAQELFASSLEEREKNNFYFWLQRSLKLG